MLPMRTFQRRLFVTLLLVALVPAAAAVLTGTVALRELVRTAGTAGPWDAVAESGGRLLDLVEERGDAELLGAAERHRAELSESLRLSRLYAFVAERFLQVLPFLAIALAGGAALLAYVTARRLSRQLSSPVEELVDWTGRIARQDPLPPPNRGRRIQEFERLENALRSMDEELRRARRLEADRIRMRSWTETARTVAHELKNPLAPMRVAATRVARAGGRQGGGEVAEAGRILLEEIERLDALARSFSNFGRPPEGPVSQVDLVELLQGLIRREEGGPAAIELHVPDSLPWVRGQPDALGRVFRNLVANALEAGPGAPTSSPAVCIQGRPSNGSVEIRVRDHGPGISEEDLDRLWDPAFTTKRRGTGLGLALVRRTVEWHGGRVEARNHPDGGAEFTVLLPVSGPPPGPREA